MQQYSDEFKEQVLAEVDQVGNAACTPGAARFRRTPFTADEKPPKNGSASALPKAKAKRLEELKKRMKLISTENERLKRPWRRRSWSWPSCGS